MAEELEDALTIALAGGRPHVEQLGAGKTPPLVIGHGQTLAMLVRGAREAGVIRVVGPGGLVDTVVVPSNTTRRIELVDVPAGEYRVEVDAGALYVRAWPETAGSLLDDPALGARVRSVDAGDLDELLQYAAARITTVGRTAAYGVSVPVDCSRSLAVVLRLVEAEPYRSAYLIRRLRQPSSVNHRGIARVVDRCARALAHVEVDVVSGLPLVLELAVPAGSYRLVLSGLVDKTTRPVPIEGVLCIPQGA